MTGFPHFSLTGSSTPFADVTTSILDVDVNVRFLLPKFQFRTLPSSSEAPRAER